ncbi:MAG: LPS export ABC transporter periplasmic protein LptC [Bacteroidales bacterium]|nr:LPS export ABC transporter periplasmic protein LptC [Bacteroidales bacterium]
MRQLLAWALSAVALMEIVSTLTACSDGNSAVVAGAIDPETFATMTTRDVETLISDSGITRYRIEAPLWLVFDEAKEPRWTFPEGMHIERFDNFFQREATIDCDSATYFRQKQLWRLDGYVDISNMAGERFKTQQLFWDQKKQTVYSDSFIHIERVDRVIEGYGFISDEKMTQYEVLNVQAILPVQERQASTSSVPTDSIAASPTRSTPTRRSLQRPSAAEAETADTIEPPVSTPAATTPKAKTAPKPLRKPTERK